jgi:Spy/CpxP family protein refolding chaperone
MRSLISSSVLVLTLTLAGSTAIYAQAPQDQPQGQRPHGQFHHEQNPQFEVKMLTKRLSLSPEQAAQIEPILADRDARFKALKPAEGTTPDFKALRQEHKAIMEDTHAKINAVLTPEQQAKLREHEGHGPRGNWKPQGGSTPSA